MTRLSDWPERLTECVERYRDHAFTWGQHDCATFALDAIRAMTGETLCAPLHEEYSTAFGAVLAMRRRCAAQDLGGCADAILLPHGCTAIHPKLAKRGDILLVKAPETESFPQTALAVCLGKHAAAPGKNGLVFVPAYSALRAWGV